MPDADEDNKVFVYGDANKDNEVFLYGRTELKINASGVIKQE